MKNEKKVNFTHASSHHVIHHTKKNH